MQDVQSIFDELFSTFSDATVYFCMAMIGSILFGIKLLLTMFVGVDSDFDVDADVDLDGGDIAEHGTGFSLFSMLSILSFMMGAGWMGLACRVEWDMGAVASGLAAGGFGFSLMLFSSFGMYQMRKLNEAGKYDVRNCIGSIGRAYVRIPAKGDGTGQVQIDVDGRQKILTAVSSGEEIESFAAVKVLDVQEAETIIVEKHT